MVHHILQKDSNCEQIEWNHTESLFILKPCNLRLVMADNCIVQPLGPNDYVCEIIYILYWNEYMLFYLCVECHC